MPSAPPAADPLGVHPVGTVRASDGDWFAQAITDGISSTATDLEVDLRDVGFMDGSGVRALAAAAERLAASGRQLIVRAPAYVIEVALTQLAPPGSVTIYRA
jgi:anti-anti-sigma regulatory factor